MNDEIGSKLNEIDEENIIWFIYVGIIFLSWYANDLERDYFLSGKIKSKEKYQKVMILIFSILVIVYFYFFKNSLDSLNQLTENDSSKKKRLVYLSFLGLLFIVMSGLIFLYIALIDQDIDVEIAFN